MSRFVTELQYVESTRDGYFKLTHALVYDSDKASQRIIAVAGFETNFVTGRKLLFVRRIVNDGMNEAAVIHDELYETGVVSRSMADDVFLEAMEVLGVAWWRRWAAWSAVRLAGASHYNDRK